MTITFPQSCFLLALFFFRSPFEPDKRILENAGFRCTLGGRRVPVVKDRPTPHRRSKDKVDLDQSANPDF